MRQIQEFSGLEEESEAILLRKIMRDFKISGELYERRRVGFGGKGRVYGWFECEKKKEKED